MRLPAKVLYRYKEYCAPGEKVLLSLHWEPGSFDAGARLWARRGSSAGGNIWEPISPSPQALFEQDLQSDFREGWVSHIERGPYSGCLPVEILAAPHDGAFPWWKVSLELDLPQVSTSTTTIIDGSTHGEGQGSVVFGSRFNGLTVNSTASNLWKSKPFDDLARRWRPALTPFFQMSSEFQAGGGLSGAAALLARGGETASIDCRSWRQEERDFFRLEPPSASAMHRGLGKGPISTGSQRRQWLAATVTPELTVGRLHVHDDAKGAHWPLGWRLEEVASITKAEFERELAARDPSIRERANLICDRGRLDMNRRHGMLNWNPQAGLQVSTLGEGTLAVEPMAGDPLLGPWKLTLCWNDGLCFATLQVNRETVHGARWLNWFWATQSQPDGAPQLEERYFIWFPWEWTWLSQEELDSQKSDRAAFWGRIGDTPFLWALQEDGSLAFYDEEELPREILHGESHG